MSGLNDLDGSHESRLYTKVDRVVVKLASWRPTFSKVSVPLIALYPPGLQCLRLGLSLTTKSFGQPRQI